MCGWDIMCRANDPSHVSAWGVFPRWGQNKGKGKKNKRPSILFTAAQANQRLLQTFNCSQTVTFWSTHSKNHSCTHHPHTTAPHLAHTCTCFQLKRPAQLKKMRVMFTEYARSETMADISLRRTAALQPRLRRHTIKHRFPSTTATSEAADVYPTALPASICSIFPVV